MRGLAALPFAFAVALAGGACGARSELALGPCGDGDAPACVAPSADPCGPPAVVPAACDAAAHAFTCPAGSYPYARAEAPPAVCLPFSDPAGPVRSVGGSLVRVPTDDGRCLWIAEAVTLGDGTALRNVAFEPDRTAPFGTCPTAASFAGGAAVSAVHVDTGDDPDLLVQIASAFRFAGRTQVAYRLFQVDASAVFGVTLLGGGLGRWDAPTQRIVVAGLGALQFSPDLDLGDASLVTPDFAFVWGCPKQDGFTHDCVVGRFDATGAMTLFAGNAGWIPGQTAAGATTVFTAGPWISSVVPDAGDQLLHVWASGFGSSLLSHLATAPEGPWTDGASLGACDLPGSDASSYCAGPIVHRELADPTHAGEAVVSYGVGTTAANGGSLMSASPLDYWSRLVWTTGP